MSESSERLLKSIQKIEAELATIKQALKDLGVKEEGVVGTFDGEYVQLTDGRRFPIPPNYASKSMLVAGDTLRMMEDPNGGDQHRYKQIAKVERGKATGILTRKDGKYEVICEEGSFKVMTAAVNHFEAAVGDSLFIHFAKNHPKGSWAAIEKKAAPTATSVASEVAQAPVTTAQPLATTATAVTHAQPTVAPAPASTVPAQPTPAVQTPVPATQAVQEQVQAVSADPVAAPTPSPSVEKQETKQENSVKEGNSSKNRKSRSKSKSSQAKKKTDSGSGGEKKATAPSSSPRPATPQPSLPVDQGEIAIPAIIDDDDLT